MFAVRRKYGISFFNPQLREWNAHYIALEAAVKDSCQLLLYVITANTRGITSMIEVRLSRTERGYPVQIYVKK